MSRDYEFLSLLDRLLLRRFEIARASAIGIKRDFACMLLQPHKRTPFSALIEMGKGAKYSRLRSVSASWYRLWLREKALFAKVTTPLRMRLQLRLLIAIASPHACARRRNLHKWKISARRTSTNRTYSRFLHYV